MTTRKSQDTSVIARVSQYVSGATFSQIPPGVVEKAKHHILDTIAAMVSGSQLKPGELAIGYARSLGGTQEAQVVSSDVVTTAVNAALANGILAHADETDDSHAPSGTHPGCGIIPAALAMAERENSDGAAFLTSVVVGYDIGCRITQALGGSDLLRALNRDTHGIGTAFGAAAAAANLVGMDADRVRYVLSYAAQQASGVTAWARDVEHTEKAFDFGGMGTRNGVTAATMVQAGFTGVWNVFEGERNFMDAFSQEHNLEKLARDLGRQYEISLASIKKYPVGYPIQAALDALLIIMRRDGVSARDVERLVARLPDRGARTVDNREMSDINIQHILSIALIDGDVTFASSHSYERMRDPAVLEMKSRVELVTDEVLSKATPSRQAIIEIATKDGRQLREHVVAIRGAPENPATTEEVEAKARDLLLPVLGQQRTEGLIEAIARLERVGSVRELRPLLTA